MAAGSQDGEGISASFRYPRRPPFDRGGIHGGRKPMSNRAVRGDYFKLDQGKSCPKPNHPVAIRLPFLGVHLTRLAAAVFERVQPGPALKHEVYGARRFRIGTIPRAVLPDCAVRRTSHEDVHKRTPRAFTSAYLRSLQSSSPNPGEPSVPGGSVEGTAMPGDGNLSKTSISSGRMHPRA